MRLRLLDRVFHPAGDDAGNGRPGIEVLPAEPGRTRETMPASPHVLVSISGTEPDRELIRHGRVLADLLNARLTVLYAFRLGACDRRRDTLRDDRVYAHSLGAQLVELPAFSESDGVAEYARARAVTHIVLDETHSSSALVDLLSNVDWYFVRDRHGHALLD